jgi:hypothetical protein
MAIGTKICRVCGKEYESCHTLRPNLNSEFRWQDVACCPEHGQEYLMRILRSRGIAPKEEPKVEPKAEEKHVKKTARKRKSEPADAPVAQEPEKGEVA